MKLRSVIQVLNDGFTSVSKAQGLFILLNATETKRKEKEHHNLLIVFIIIVDSVLLHHACVSIHAVVDYILEHFVVLAQQDNTITG